jgi:hypothetical protein
MIEIVGHLVTLQMIIYQKIYQNQVNLFLTMQSTVEHFLHLLLQNTQYDFHPILQNHLEHSVYLLLFIYNNKTIL